MTNVREAALQSKAWPYEEARKLLKRWPNGKPDGAPMVFETGYGPSGMPHIGTFTEVLRTTMVRRAYEELTGGAPTRLIAFSDDMDGLRKVPDNVPNPALLAANLGKPLSRIPNPFPTDDASFAAHNNAMLRRFLDSYGFDYEFVSAADMYNGGQFDEALLGVLRHWGDILDIMLPTLREERRQTYSPTSPRFAFDRRGAASPGRGCRCAGRHDPVHRRGRVGRRTVRAWRHGQMPVEGRLGDALGRAWRRL